ncbi:MAG: NAD(+) synthase, partial [Herbaspirillum sp.]
MPSPFFNLYNHGFARVAVAVPDCKVADPGFNAERTIALAEQAAARGAALVSFPELGLSAYSCEDLFQQRALLEASLQALQSVLQASLRIAPALIVGLPLKVDHQLYNCAVVVHAGRILGVVPKSYLPNYSEFYEARQFSSADCAVTRRTRLLGQDVDFGSHLLFEIGNIPDFRFHIEICEDVWVPIPPSSFAALAGATVLVNLSASNIVVGKSGYRHQLVSQQSARCLAAYLYSSAGNGESTTDLAWDGQALICENGELLAESERFAEGGHVIYADIDLERLSRERFHQTTFGQSVRRHADEVRRFEVVRFDVQVPQDQDLPLQRRVARFPYVPANAEQRELRCREVYNIQVQALVQ